MMNAHDYLTQTLDVSRETMGRLKEYEALLRHWQKSINLIAPDSVSDIWGRHIVDSAQLIRLVPEARTWADLGSGAGLPGMIVGILLSDIPNTCVYLVESNRKKSAFLRDAKRKTGAAVEILSERIESPAVQSRIAHVDVVTARALASLSQLFDYSHPVLANGARGLYLKGRTVEAEIAECQARWSFDIVRHASVGQPESTIVDVRSLHPREG